MLRKVKAVGMYVMKACRGDCTIAALIINLGARWRCVVSVTPRPLCRLGKNVRFPSSSVYYCRQKLLSGLVSVWYQGAIRWTSEIL